MGILGRIFQKSKTKGEKNKSSDRKLAEDYFEKGADLAKQEKWAEAIIALKEAVRLNPNHAKAHMGLAIAYGGAMDMQSARQHYETLKKLDPILANKLADTPAGMLILRTGRIIRM